MAKGGSLIDGVLENSMSVGLQANLKNSIENAGIDVPASACLWQYPEIIRKNLVAKTVTGINILGKDLIKIDTTCDGDILTYNISTNFDTHGVPRPNYANPTSKWGKEITVESLMDDLFRNVLPNVRGVYSGDMTITNLAGDDTTEWYNRLFNQRGFKRGLKQTSRYLRLYLTCQAEPIYIDMGNLLEEITNGYTAVSSDTVTFEIDDTNNSLKAHINVINDEQLVDLGILSEADLILPDPEPDPIIPEEPETPENENENI